MIAAIAAMLGLLALIAAPAVFVEGINKLERSAPFHPGLPVKVRALELMRVAAWLCQTLAAGGIVMGMLIGPVPAQPLLALAVAGTGLHVIRARLQEVIEVAPTKEASQDGYDLTVAMRISPATDWEAIRQAVYNDRARLAAALAYGEAMAKDARAVDAARSQAAEVQNNKERVRA